MHPALLIDEVLEAILEKCSEWDRKEYKWTLSQVARSCNAWKDPALDRLWGKLDSEEPLVPLLCLSGEVSTTTSALITI